MNEVFKQVKADKIIRLSMTLACILIVLHTLYLGFFYFSLPPIVPLYNQLPWGEPRLGSRIEIILPLVITTVFFTFNYILLAKLYTTMPLVSRIVSITSLLAAVLSMIFIVRTIQLII